MNREQALETAKKEGWWFLEHAKEFRGDKEIMMEAIKTNNLIGKVHKKLLKDKEFMMVAVQSSGNNLGRASDDLKKDPELVLEAVKSHAGAIQYADPSLYSNKEIMLQAVYRCGEALKFASDDLKNDFDVVRKAVEENIFAYKYASYEMQCDKMIVMSFIRGGSFIDIPEEVRDLYRKDKDVAKAAIISDARNSTHFYPDLFNDRSLMDNIFGQWGFAIGQFPQYQDDKDLALVAVQRNGESIKFLSKQLKNDPEVVLAAIKDNYSAGEEVGDEIFQQLKSVIPHEPNDYKREILHNAIPYLEDLVKAKKLSEKLDSELSEKPSKADRLVASIDHDAEPKVKRTSSSRMKI
ncbi:DUF4116 domain-containing protein [Burkholderia contaminans]|uniref:DUF4116 domain-containing protein n=1 Tax=Burkholderia contaminans TaxID=488447 RepID=UPI0015889200|nr:DUF4116 domain-containing protein [Burkholderia contaminans]